MHSLRFKHFRAFSGRIVLSVLILTLILASSASTERNHNKKEPVTLKFTVLQASEGSPKIEWRANALMAKKFFQDHDDIRLQMLSDLALPPGMNIQGADTTMQMVGDAGPDVFWILSQDMPRYLDQGFLMPLDDYVKNWPEAKERLTGPVREMCSSIGRDGKKHIYALPFAVTGNCLYYNKKRFREAGLVDSKGQYLIPHDWNELWEFSKKLTDPDKDPETGFRKHWAIELYLEGWCFDQFPPLAGGRLWERRKDGRWVTLVDSKAAVQSLDFFKKMCWGDWVDAKGRHQRGVMEMSYTAQTENGQGSTLKIQGHGDLQDAGIIAMSILPLYSAFNERMYKDPLNYGMCPFPKYPGPQGRYASRLGGEFYGISSTVKDKRVADAAWKFISFNCGDEGERLKTKIFVDNGVARYVNPALLRKYGYPRKVIDQVPKDWAQAYKDVSSSLYAGVDPPGMTAIENELKGPCQQLLRDPNLDTKKALDKVQNVVARSYLYSPTEEEMAHNRKVALVAVIAMVCLMAGGGILTLRMQMRENLSAERDKVYTRRVPKSKQTLAWLLMAPAIISVFLWQYVPVAWGSVMAFLNVHILGGSEWVGLDNFIRVAIRPLYWLAWKNTVVYVFLSLSMTFVAPIVLALLLSEIPKGKTLFRTLYYLPALTTGVVTMLLWMRFYGTTQFGLMNRLLMGINDTVLVHINNFMALLHLPLHVPLFGLQMWLQDPRLAMAATILPSVWAGMGPGCIIYLAALKAVPEEQYDAADLDGAGIFQKAWHVTLPTIFPLVLINFLGAFIGAFSSSGNILVMTGGGPDHATHVMGLEIFYQGYVLANYGQTTAIAWILASLLVGFAVMNMKVFSKMKFSTAEQQGQ